MHPTFSLAPIYFDFGPNGYYGLFRVFEKRHSRVPVLIVLNTVQLLAFSQLFLRAAPSKQPAGSLVPDRA